MGYSGAVRMMVLDEVVSLNEQLESRMDAIITDLGKLERDMERSHDWLRDCTKSMRQIEVDVGGLMAQQAFIRGLMDWMQSEMDALLQLNLVLGTMVLNMRAAMQHGCNNLIVVEDDEEVVDTAPVDHTLVKIVEETPERTVVDDWEESPKV